MVERDSSERLRALRESRGGAGGGGGIAYYLPVGAIALFLVPLLILPIFAIFWFALKAGLDRFFAALASPEAMFAIKLSIFVAAVTSAINAVLGTATAYVLSKYRLPGRNAISILVNLPIAIPTVVAGTSLLLLWGPIGLLGRFLEPYGLRPMFTPVGIVLAHVFVTFPYMLGGVKPVLDELEPSYEEAAYTMGATRLQTFWYVMLPALRGGLFAGTLLTFAHSLGEFGATVMVSGNLSMQTQTAPLYIYAQFEAGHFDAANAVAAVLAVVSFVIFYGVIRLTEKGPRRGS